MADRRTLLRGSAALAAGTWLTGYATTAQQPDSAQPDGSRLEPTALARTALTPSRGHTGTGTGTDWSALARSLHGPLIRPDDARYDTARRLYNTRFDALRPAAVAYVAGTADITECLAFARHSDIPVSVRNGGHSYAGWSSGTGHLVIDVSSLAAIHTSTGHATIGAGAKLIDVYNTLGARGVTIPAGSCPTVGISGLALGGGHGVASRAYGLTCDNLTGATLVTADGRTVTADARTNPDLFWALRGAGCGNFGVVTELRFRTHPAADCVTAYATLPWSKAAAAIGEWQQWGPSQPDEIWSSLHLDCSAGGAPSLSLAAFSLGSYDELASAVDRLISRIGGRANSVSLRRHTYLEAMNAYAGCTDRSPSRCHLPGSTPGRTPTGQLGRGTYLARSDFFNRPLPAAGAAALVAGMERLRAIRGGGAGGIALTALGGAVDRVAPTATAFVHRSSHFLAQYIAAGALGNGTWLTGLYTALRPYASGEAYQNYTDPRLTNWRHAYYGSAAGRLTQLKHQWDPNRLFDFPQAL
jgi:hypothetical protein